jgi:hypothetical protein
MSSGFGISRFESLVSTTPMLVNFYTAVSAKDKPKIIQK